MATVAELKAGECEWEACRLNFVGLQPVKRMGRNEGARNTSQPFRGRSVASGPAERPEGVAAAARGP